MMAYLEGEEPSIPDLKKCIRKGTLSPPLLLSPLPLPSPFPLILGPSPSSSALPSHPTPTFTFSLPLPISLQAPLAAPSCPCSPAPPSRTRACSRCSTPSSTTCTQPRHKRPYHRRPTSPGPTIPGRAAQQLACPPRASTSVRGCRVCCPHAALCLLSLMAAPFTHAPSPRAGRRPPTSTPSAARCSTARRAPRAPRRTTSPCRRSPSRS